MSIIEHTEAFIGKELRGIFDVTWVHEERNGTWLYAIAFAFDDTFLIFRAESTDDTVSAHECKSLEQWITSQEDGDELRYSENKYWSSLIGHPLVYVWECQNTKGYIDAVDLAFRHLLFPSIKILCAGSQLYLLSIQALKSSAG
ncbi:MAG: DUF6334 family protein [Candidatus Binatia bacterium]